MMRLWIIIASKTIIKDNTIICIKRKNLNQKVKKKIKSFKIINLINNLTIINLRKEKNGKKIYIIFLKSCRLFKNKV
jgi:hypothetical protein